MDEIYPPETYGASIRFPLKRYFEEFNHIFSSEVPFPNVSRAESENEQYLLTIKNLMDTNLDLPQLEELAESCSVDLLTCEGENTTYFPVKPPDNINSSSKLTFPFFTANSKVTPTNVAKCRLEIESKKSVNQLLYGNKRSHHQIRPFPEVSTIPDLKPGSDFVVSVQIFRPFAFKYFNEKNASDKLRFNHEILALGSNTLTELRDTINCPADYGLCKEVQSTSDDLRPLEDAKGKYPSGFLFIDNVFYNDFRDPNSIDYSATILQWAKEKKLKDIQAKSMEGVRIDSLTPRFGYPYLYMHQGDCEHLLVFSDAKLLDCNDCLHSQCYPHLLKLNRKFNRMCFLCSAARAKWICIGSDRFPQNKVFLCTECCNAYNFSNGKKVGNFQLYPYYENHVS